MGNNTRIRDWYVGAMALSMLSTAAKSSLSQGSRIVYIYVPYKGIKGTKKSDWVTGFGMHAMYIKTV